jgi:hypothetical protein
MLDELAQTAGHVESLAINLKRDAAMCAYPTIKAGLERLANAKAAQANVLRKLVLDLGAWPRLPANPVHGGSSNWERLYANLSLQITVLRELNIQVVEWEHVDPAIAARLREFTVEEESNLADLRDLTLRCDPQALD